MSAQSEGRLVQAVVQHLDAVEDEDVIGMSITLRDLRRLADWKPADER